MKLNKIVLPLTVALMAMLATTGCKHGFNGKVTNLPGHRPGIAEDTTPNTLPPGPAVETTPMPLGNPNGNLNGTPILNTGLNTPTGGGELPPWNPEDFNQDREKLAAYTVHFKYDSAVVQDNEQGNVSNVAQALTANPQAKLLIEGNCDERGTEEYNRALGERRALALREALAKTGVDPLRIQTRSYGKDKPVDPGHDDAAWAKNRRGDFIYCTPKGPVQ
jgi:peptidoglycan-associated lipoprotein